LCGASGCGKTTVTVDGKKYRSRQMLKICYMVMQDVNHQLFAETVPEEVMLGADDSEQQTALDILEKLHIEEYKDRHPMSLSGGQKQRLAVACALASGSDILLFDEPTSGLDYRHMQQTADLMKGLREMGKTLVVVTHDSEFIRSCCDCTLAIKNGRPA
ncbi:MAG TPA: ABC transporter, partial [Eggerthellaceae bacterium]|nr:ABC transporter [Eggerthellaceae bacterium]